MTTHQTPEWETRTTPKKTLFSRPLNPFRNNGGATIDHTRSFWSMKKSPFSSVGHEQTAMETVTKETGSREVTSTTVRPWWKQKRMRIILGVLALAILILIIGLAVGLSKKGSKSKAKNLPLPSNTNTFTGDITYYSPGPGYGACGFENTDKDSICAVSQILFDASAIDKNPNHNPLCGKKIRITRFDASANGNHSVDVTVVDRCVGCKAMDLDLSMKMFTSLADEALGRTTASWAWLN